jgi:hypothetical protein
MLEPLVGWQGLFLGVAGLGGATLMLLLPYRPLLERVMNLGGNRMGMRILRLAQFLATPRFPHLQAILCRVHNSL